MKRIPMVKGYYAEVDDDDYDYFSQFNWCPALSTNTYYALGYINGQPVSMHRVIMDVEPGMEIDHIDGNGLNNQKSNLRIVSHKENSKNRHPRESSVYIHIACGNCKKQNVRTWKADPEYERLLKALKRANVEKSESGRVRAGLVLLATANGVEIPEKMKVQ